MRFFISIFIIIFAYVFLEEEYKQYKFNKKNKNNEY